MCGVRLQGLPLENVTEAELIAVLKLNANISDDGPNLRVLCDAAEGAA